MEAPAGSRAARAGPEPAGGFTVLDGVGLVIGAAVASIHLRDLVAERSLSAFGWGLVWLTFSGIALTAAGPFVFLGRRFVRRVAEHPRIGDWLWLLLGLPWVLTAAIRPDGMGTLLSTREGIGGAVASELYTIALWLLLATASISALVVVWRTWVLAAPEQLRERESTPWTDRVGLVLAVAWPLQCGFGLVVAG